MNRIRKIIHALRMASAIGLQIIAIIDAITAILATIVPDEQQDQQQ